MIRHERRQVTATYRGHLVHVTSMRRRQGRVICDVRRHPDEADWPYLRESFPVPVVDLHVD